MLDKQTASRSRMAYARICVEIAVDSDFPSHIDALVGDVKIKVPVEYSWRPPRCQHCNLFGHTQAKCSVAAAAAVVVAAEAAKVASAAKLVQQASAPKDKTTESNGWQVKNLKRSRGKIGGKNDEASRGGTNGASSSKSNEATGQDTSVFTQNKFHQLEEATNEMNVEVPVVHVIMEDNILQEIGGNKENEMIMEEVMSTSGQQSVKGYTCKSL